MDKEKIIGTFTVASKKRMELFRIHLFEKSVRFDEHFAKAITANKKIFKKIFNISEKWSNGELKYNEVFINIIEELKNHENYLSKYYFKKKDLDETGRLIEPLPINTMDNESWNYMESHFQYLKKKGILKRITRKDFEKKIIDKKISEFYIDNYPKEKVACYFYEAFIEDRIKNCYVLSENNELVLGFEE